MRFIDLIEVATSFRHRRQARRTINPYRIKQSSMQELFPDDDDNPEADQNRSKTPPVGSAHAKDLRKQNKTFE